MSTVALVAGSPRLRPVRTGTPRVAASVYATRHPDIWHVRTTETAPGGEVLRQAVHRLRAANAETAAAAALWLFRHSQPLPCAGFFVWR